MKTLKYILVKAMADGVSVDYRVALIALLWLSASLCLVNCISLLVSVLRHKGGRTGDWHQASVRKSAGLPCV